MGAPVYLLGAAPALKRGFSHLESDALKRVPFAHLRELLPDTFAA